MKNSSPDSWNAIALFFHPVRITSWLYPKKWYSWVVSPVVWKVFFRNFSMDIHPVLWNVFFYSSNETRHPVQSFGRFSSARWWKIKRDFSLDVYITYYLNDPQMRFFCRLHLFFGFLLHKVLDLVNSFQTLICPMNRGLVLLQFYLACESFSTDLTGDTRTNKTIKVSEWELLIWFRSLKRLLIILLYLVSLGWQYLIITWKESYFTHSWQLNGNG